MRFKKMALVIPLIIAILLTSCSRVQELDTLGIVIATAIDMVNGKVLLTHEVIVPKSNTTNSNIEEPNVKYVQSTGDTVFDALRNATLIFDRKLFLAHNRVIILGEELARDGIGPIINFYVSDNEPRESAAFVVAKGSFAYEIMGINGGLGDTPGGYLFDLLENYSVNLKSRNFKLNEYIRYFLQGENTVLPIVQHIQQLEINKDEQKSVKDALDVIGGAVFHKDKLIGYFNGDEMRGFNFIIDEFENGLIVFQTPDELVNKNKLLADSGDHTVIEVKRSDTRNRVEQIDGKLHLKINVNIKGTLIEDTKGIIVSDDDVLDAIKLACSNKVEEYITMTMDKAQKEFKIDPFSIGNLVHIKYPNLWREISHEWESIFSDLEYEVNVETDLIRSGLINTPTNVKLDKNRIKENK